MSTSARNSLTRAWATGYESLTDADGSAPLDAEDLELLAMSAFMLGYRDEYAGGYERAYRAYMERGETLDAARCARVLCVYHEELGQAGHALGWYTRACRLLERVGRDCVERGYLLFPVILRHEAAADFEAARSTAAEAVAIGERFDEADLIALALQEQGRILFRLGRVDEGLGLLDEAMLAAVAGELSPAGAAFVYCNVIDGCLEVYELGRAQEWTTALMKWCEQQPDMVAFTSRCRAQRAQIMLLQGAWGDARDELRRVDERLTYEMRPRGVARCGLDLGQAFYWQGELHRLQGAFAAAEQAYGDARGNGWEPQPGLALLRLAQGNREAAAAAIRRALGETTDVVRRAALLPAYVEIMLAVEAREEADRACRELEQISESWAAGMTRAMAAHARGAVSLADGDARAALTTLRLACRLWRELEAPYEAARTRALIGLACRALGDEDAAGLELDAARDIFEALGATPDLARVEELARSGVRAEAHGLTARELQVLRMVAGGASNKAIAGSLGVSVKTVERHVSNVFAKLGLSSRAAATAYAYERRLVA